MNETETKECLIFRQIRIEDKENYDKHLAIEGERGCEFSFANLFLWGRQALCECDEALILFSQFDRRTVYPYPLAARNRRSAIDKIIADAHGRGIACRISGLTADACEELENLYPERFRFHCDEGSFDYVYLVDELADLAGKRFDGKRNHIRRFKDAYPDFKVNPITPNDANKITEFLDGWYERRLADDPKLDFHMERAALSRALSHLDELELYGIMLTSGEEILAFTLASRLSDDTLDVHFEKARGEIQGAYAAINREFAAYVRENMPNIKYLNREEDMGLEGLRRAKRSYHPHHMVEKCWACLLEDGYDY